MPIDLAPIPLGSINWGTTVNNYWSDIESAINSFEICNRIINGDMKISQRGTSFGSIADTNYSLDRWQYVKDQSSCIHTITQDNSSVPPHSQAGILFKNSLKALVTTADSTPGTGDIVSIRQIVEGYNICDIVGDGYNSGFTLSFWVRDAIAGIHCVRFYSGNRSYVAEYTIENIDTWEHQTIYVSVAPSGGTWNSTNGAGLFVEFPVLAGSDYVTSTPNTWVTGNKCATSGIVNSCNAISNVFQITGVQLVRGSLQTPFQFRPFSSELALCQRYYEASSNSPGSYSSYYGYGVSGSVESAYVRFKVTKRISTTVSLVNVQNAGFPSSTGLSGEDEFGFRETRVASTTGGNIYFSSSWVSDAEL